MSWVINSTHHLKNLSYLEGVLFMGLWSLGVFQVELHVQCLLSVNRRSIVNFAKFL